MVLELTTAFFLSLAHCETRGEGNPDTAVNPAHDSYGRYQITDVYRNDVNRIAHTSYTREDCFNKAKSEEMIRIYMAHYCTQERLGRIPVLEDAARIHHLGPNGWKNPAAYHYVQLFRDKMKELA